MYSVSKQRSSTDILDHTHAEVLLQKAERMGTMKFIYWLFGSVESRPYLPI